MTNSPTNDVVEGGERLANSQAPSSDSERSQPSFVSNYLSYLLAQASHLVSTEFHAHLRRYGVAVPTWRVLATLSDGEGKTVGEIARIGLYNQPTATKIIDRMEAEGLAERHRDPDDKRKTLVFITAAGEALVDELMVDAIAHENRVLEGYSAEEVALLKKVLRTLIMRLGQTA